MKQITAVVIGLMVMTALFQEYCAAEPDAKGSKDHPMLTRMPDFYIGEYKTGDFDSHKFVDENKKQVSIEGRKYYFRYYLNKGAAQPGELKIRRNIQEALKTIGGNVLFDDNFNRMSTIVVAKDGNETWIEVKTLNDKYFLTIVERKAMKQEVTATAVEMGNDINSTGHVAIYGIYFDTGKSDIKPESDQAISEIAKLLQGDTGLKVYVVGHTDNAGSFESNLKLSKDRAEAVAKTLTGKHGIDAARLKPHGVSSLAPVASNDTEDGKAKNRRVELVKQ